MACVPSVIEHFMIQLRLILIVLTLIVAVDTRAQTSPASAPTTQVSADQSSPRGALKVLSVAMENGDSDALRNVLSATSAQEQRMLKAIIAQQSAIAQLRDAAVQSFGADDARKL